METMKAAVVREVGKVVIEEVPLPPLEDYAVLCRNLYGATCTATDQHIIDQVIAFPVPLPTLLGHESIGRIVAPGPKVRHLAVGQRVTRTLLPPLPGLNTAWGGYAQYGLAYDWQAMREDGLPEKVWRSCLRHRPLPEDIPDRDAPLLITWRETHSFLMRMGLRPGMRALVIGTGGNGLSFAAHAAREGASAWMIGSPGRAGNAALCGAEGVIGYKAPDAAEQLAAAAGEGFDLVIDAVGSAAQVRMALPFLKKGGVLGVYGINEPVVLPAGDYTRHDGSYLEGETHDRVVEGWRAGFYRAEAFYDREHPYSLERLEDAFAMLRTRAWPKALIEL